MIFFNTITIRMIKSFALILLAAAMLFSCGKESEKKKTAEKETQSSDTESDTDTVLSPEEEFSSALTLGIAGDDEITDLQIYLEDEIYPSVNKSDKVTLDRISASVYLLTYSEGGVMKNFTLQRFYNPAKEEVFFEKKEIQTDAVKQFVK